MATEGLLRTFSFEANADLSALQYTFVKIVAGKKVDSATAVGEDVIGILQNKPVSGATAVVAIVGSISKCKAGADLVVGTQVIPGSGGKAADWTTGRAAGILIGDPAADGEIVEVLVL